jgi:SAM-dependent methyltransferase
MRAFIEANKRLSDKLGKLFSRNQDLYRLYEEEVAACPGFGLEIGAGRHARPKNCIAADLSAGELRHNESGPRLCMDATSPWPFTEKSLDFVSSRWLLEHVPNTRAFVREAAATLTPGGRFVHLLACRYSMIASMNRLLPHSVSLRLLQQFFPESGEVCGFEAHYDLCWPGALRRLCEEHGLEVERIDIVYAQAWYFSFFVPFFLLCLAFDWARRLLHLENTCHCFLLVASRRVSCPPREDSIQLPAPIVRVPPGCGSQSRGRE